MRNYFSILILTVSVMFFGAISAINSVESFEVSNLEIKEEQPDIYDFEFNNVFFEDPINPLNNLIIPQAAPIHVILNQNPQIHNYSSGQVRQFWFRLPESKTISIYSECQGYGGQLDNYDLKVDLYRIETGVIVLPDSMGNSRINNIYPYIPIYIKSDNNSGYNRQFYLRQYVEENIMYRFDVKALSIDPNTTCAIFFTDQNYAYGIINDYKSGSNLVNLFKEIVYDIDSEYETEILDAINKWNALGKVKFKPSGWNIVTVRIKDSTTLPDNVLGRTTYAKGLIELNANYFENASYGQRMFVILHELGHALGIDMDNVGDTEETFTNVMMPSYERSLSEIGPADRAVYFAIWG